MNENGTAVPPLPQLIPRAQLHALLRPNLTDKGFDNWLSKVIAKEAFPQPLRISKRSVAWEAPRVKSWLEARPRGGKFDGKRKAG